MLLICLSCAWVAGIFLGSSLHLPLALSLTGLIPLPLLLTRRHRSAVILASLGLFTFFSAAAYGYASRQTIDESHLQFYNDGGVVEVRGVVAGDPDIRDKNTRLTLTASEIKLAEGWREVKGETLVFVPRYPAYHYGDRLQLKGELKTPPQLDGFDYRGYLAHQGIYATMLYPRIEVLAKGKGSRPLAWVYSLRSRLSQSLSVLPEPQASLAQGIVLGLRGNIPQALNDDFARSGTAHLLAISGIHLSIMVGILLSAGIWLLGRQYYLYVWLALGVIWLYALITGLNPPVVRSAIMASLFLVAELLGRQRQAIVALALAAAVMVGISPYILGDAAFQLSFLAMAGLIFVAPVFQNLGRRAVIAVIGENGATVSLANVAVDTLSVTLAAIIAVWPVVAYYFGMVSLVGLLATFLALPALPGIIVTGTLTAVVGLLILPIAQVVGWLAWLCLSYMILVVHGLAAPSLSSVAVGSVSPAFIGGYYLALAAAVWLSRRWRWPRTVAGTAGRFWQGAGLSSGLSRPLKLALLSLLVVAALVACAAATMPDSKLRVSFLDVGEGDAILVQKGSQQVLVDGGPSPQAIGVELGRRMPFWDRTIELVVLTHPHQDHLAGLVEVLRRYQVGQVLYPDTGGGTPEYDEWLRLIEEKGIRHTIACSGQQINLGDGVLMEVLNPPEGHLSGTESDVDNNGVVLYLHDGGVSFLLTADIMKEAEWELISRRAKLASTVLKVAHHGAATSTTPEFLAVASPRVAVISAGAGNKFGHPDAEVLSRLEGKIGSENIYRTDEQGTIEFTTDGERLWVKVGK
jgi:competence protein ComEC